MDRVSEIRDGMRIEWDVPVRMDDGLVLRADVFRPLAEGRYPAILTYGPYAKGLAFQDGYPSAWNLLAVQHPDAIAGSSNKYQSWELVDPEKWVPDGYACVRVDSRGAGRSPGHIDPWSPRETRDLHDCIEWAAAQPWCNGKVGLNGISYYAINAWHVAALQPPHLTAMCVWEGAADFYRDMTHHQLALVMDAFRQGRSKAISVLFTRGERPGIHVAVTDDLVAKGVQAGKLAGEIAALSGGKGGGRPHFASAGAGDPARLDAARAGAPEIVKRALAR